MKNLTLLLSLCLIVLLSCEQDKPPSDIDVKVEYLDDVSPVPVKLSINQIMHWEEWTIADSMFYHPSTPEDKGVFLYTFDNTNPLVVKYNGSKSGGEHYSGQAVIDPMSLASKFVVKGIYFPEDGGIIVDDEILELQLYYNNREDNPTVRTKVNVESGYCNDTLWFNEPLTVNINELGTEKERDCGFYFSIYRHDPKHSVFYGNVGLYDSYYISREMFYNRLTFNSNDNKTIYLIVDWQP